MSLGRRGGSCQLSVISDQLSVGAENRRAGIRDAWGERRREGLGRNPWVARTRSFSGEGVGPGLRLRFRPEGLISGSPGRGPG